MDIRTISSTAYSRIPASVIAVGSGDTSANDAKPSQPVAPYLSPVYKFDPIARLNILTYRDTTTGAVTARMPSEKVIEQYRRNRGASPEQVATEKKQEAAATTANAPTTVGTNPDIARSQGASQGAGTESKSFGRETEGQSAPQVVTAPITDGATGTEPVAAKSAPAQATVPAPEIQRVSLKV